MGLNEDRVEQFLTGYLKLNRELFVFHVGWFQDTIPKCDIDAIALLRIDGDWYDSTKTCLEGLYDRVVSSGIVIIDDFGRFSGCRKAVVEFFESRNCEPLLHSSDESCVYFIKP